MNSPGLKFVDDFNSKELKPLIPVFLKSAYIIYAHCVLQRHGGMGYTSQWAKSNFKTAAEKNEFYHEFGSCFKPQLRKSLPDFDQDVSPKVILEKIKTL